MEEVENPPLGRSLAWPGTRSLASNGYMLVYVGKNHPLADVRGYAYEHRWVMSQSIGRPLRHGEIVHHINRDKTDNRPENLVLEGSIADHKVEHRKPGSSLQMPGESNVAIVCACGCGGRFLKYDDMGRSRRFCPGHGRIKLSAGDARSIRARYASNWVSMRALAAEYGVSCSTINNIIQNRIWRHV